MVSVNRIVKGIANAGSDAFAHIHIKAPVPNPEGDEKLAGEISKEASQAASNYGKALVKRVKPDQFKENGDLDREFAIKRIRYLMKRSTKKDLIPIDEAAKELDVLPLNDEDKIHILRGCIFETGENEAKVSKGAVYMAKYALIDNAYCIPNKFQSVLRTTLDEKTMTFDLDRFYNLFGPDWHVWSDYRGLKQRVGNTSDRYLNLEYKRQASEAFQRLRKEKDIKVEIKTTDIFKPLDEFSADLTKKLDELVESGENIPKDLVDTIKKSLKEYNFDIAKIYRDYYGLLKECKTFEDVKACYPELKLPEKAPKYDPSQSKYYLSNRLAQGDFEGSIIEGLQKLYTEFLPYNDAFVTIKGSTSTTVQNLKKSGIDIEKPSDKIIEFLDECYRTDATLKKIANISKEKMEPLIERHAKKTSGVWNDFYELTKTGRWLPIKLIRNKRMYPETTKYSTDELVDTYLFNLFSRNPYERYSRNPLCRFDSIDYLDDRARNILNRTYMMRFLEKEEGLPADKYFRIYSSDFKEFKLRFDTEAIGKSLEHIEDVYHRQFYRSYWTNERLAALQTQIQKSQDIAYEKVLWGEDLRKKEVNLEQVRNMVRADEGIASEPVAKLLDPKEFSNYKYRILTIRTPQLREKFQSAIQQGQESNEEYFNVYNNILKESFNGKNVDETKAQALINIHEKYLSETIEGTQNLTEQEFKQQFLARYKTPSGIDFAKVLKDTNAESEYIKLSAKLIEENSTEFLTELERRYKDDYVGMNEIMEEYNSIPKIFKEKFRNIYINSTPNCPNVVLQRERTTFLEKIQDWHFERDELINLDKEKFGQFDDNFSQYVVIPKELKAKIWELSAQNYETCDELLTKFYNNAKKRTGESRGTGLKTLTGGKNLPPELKILGKHGGWRLYSRKATPEDIEKYGNVKYVFYDVTKTH